jgi:murein DD-endopeptidase MepM/ murein hydrolase activator NlpD
VYPLWAMLLVFRRRYAHGAVASLSALSLAVGCLVAWSGSAAASVGSDRAQIATLEQQIAAEGARVKSLVSRYDEVQARIGALDSQIHGDQARLAVDSRTESAATDALRRVAIEAYVSGVGMDSPTLMLFSDTASINTTLEQENYLGAVNGKLNDALTTLRLDQETTQAARSALRSEQARAEETLRQLATAHDAANAAIASDEAMLSRVSGNLRSVLAAASARHQAAQRAAERALVAAASSQPLPLPPRAAPSPPSLSAAPSPSTTAPARSPAPPPSQLPSPPTVPSPEPSPSPGGYANPLRAVTALSAERIDQGVDYSGFGPIYAIGNGVVLSTVNAGWPGGTFIAYRLTDGPANGLVVYAAEDIEPTVQVGATVTSSTVLGQIYAGPDGIETGWADSSASGDTMARTYGQFDGSNSTAFGENFSRFLQSVGAPGGVLQSNPSTGVLPGSWPHW